jgi:membrane fusion protein (multidrug efflux system)
VHTSFSISERERLELGIDKVKGDGDAQAVEVGVVLENGTNFEHLGKLDFIGNRIDLNTGTIAMRAVVDNPDYRLLPGQHIRVELREKRAKEVVIIPRRAVQTDLEGDFVMLVAEGSVAERRNIKLGRQLEKGIIVTEGLSADEQIITQGLQRIRNGVPVRVEQSKAAE